MSVTVLLFLILMVLKLTSVIAITWLSVVLFSLIPLAIGLVFMVVVGGIFTLTAMRLSR